MPGKIITGDSSVADAVELPLKSELSSGIFSEPARNLITIIMMASNIRKTIKYFQSLNIF